MANVEFEDNTIEVIGAIEQSINIDLEYCAAIIQKSAVRNTRVDEGDTRNAWSHYVDDERHIAYVGNTLENAIWEEFGTGEYALNGDGRKGGWLYEDKKGVTHFTYGKSPSRALHKAVTSNKSKILRRLQRTLKG